MAGGFPLTNPRPSVWAGAVRESMKAMIQLLNDPIHLVLRAARDLWPDLECTVQFVPGLSARMREEVRRSLRAEGREAPDGAGCYGVTAWFESGAPEVRLDPGFPMAEIVYTLAEELAHVAAGWEDDHGERWQRAFQALHERYHSLLEQGERAEL